MTRKQRIKLFLLPLIKNFISSPKHLVKRIKTARIQTVIHSKSCGKCGKRRGGDRGMMEKNLDGLEGGGDNRFINWMFFGLRNSIFLYLYCKIFCKGFGAKLFVRDEKKKKEIKKK